MTEVEKLLADLERRDTYVHELHLARVADQKRMEAAQRDMEDLVRWLQQAEDERDALRRRVAALEEPGLAAAWRTLRGQQKKMRVPAPAKKFVEYPHAPFTYHLRTCPFRVFREPHFLLAGWAFPNDGQPVTALRVRVDDQSFTGTYGLPEPQVIAQYGAQPENPGPGFKIVIDLPADAGRHRLSLEARLGAGDWVTIVSLPIWVRIPA